MKVIELTNRADLVLPLDVFKDHLRLGTGLEGQEVQDAVLEGFLNASLASIEARIGKAILARDFRQSFSTRPAYGPYRLLMAPVVSLNAARVRDADGVTTDLDVSRFALSDGEDRPALYDKSYGTPKGGIEFDFTAGLGATWDDVPADLAQAVLMLAAHYYEYREQQGFDGGCVPFGVLSLIERFRVFRLYSGGAA